IFKLLNKEYPVNLQYKQLSELEAYLNQLKDQNHILLLDENNKVKGWYSDFIREKERWFLTILKSEVQRKNYGTQIIEIAKVDNSELNGWVVETNDYFKANGDPYRSPIQFYKKNGFKILKNKELNNDKIKAIQIQWR
ncbi:MAG: GNAT family N-acetyltransferase, partial [Gramella sp.]|nr:GNAT family N-acetyltransferase [Christiangramia sp.]